MEEAVLMHVGQTECGLIHDTLDLLLGELRTSILHELIDVLLHEFEHEIQIVVHSDHLLKFDNLRVVELSERLDLSKSHAFFPRVEFLLHLFDSNFFFRLQVDGLDDGPVGAIA